MTETYNYGLKDLDGNSVPDSKVTTTGRDLLCSTGDYDVDAKNGIGLYCQNGTRMLLSSVDRTRVKFVGGLWRMQQTRYKYNITPVRDKKFILGEKIEHSEKNLFEYYRAAEVFENCYGLIQPRFDYIVAKYETDNGPMWSYGTTIEQARAFLGIALFDKHIKMIHSAEHTNTEKNK